MQADDGTSAGIRSGPLTAERSHPDRIGPYRVLQLLGEGGMGMVYLAEQHEPVHREVALKVLRAGVNTDEVIARFESERQALAVMEHPNITRVYDAGATESGLPYFVMERVAGVPITDYARTHQLTARDRAKLVVQVCRAVQHAHQKGIIHRDIKPSNVLVMESDGEPLCKVIDFGIAKATAPSPESFRLTATGMVVGTPAYMSPEQFMSDGADIDTRSDIYSLGVLLYELVAGVLPFESGPRPGMRHSSKPGSSDATAPSIHFAALDTARRLQLAQERRTDPEALRRTLSGDLDCIILKTLESDRERRYATANALAADIERFLAFEPVMARHQSASYRLSKFVRRHRASVGLSAALLTLIVVVAIGATVQARRLSVARRIAVARQAQAEELIDFMLGDLRERLATIGKLDVLDDVGKKALAYFAAVPESELSDDEQFRRALAMQQLGKVREAQGKVTEAAPLMKQSLSLMSSLAARDTLNPRWQLELAHSHFYAGQNEWVQGNVDAAVAHWEPFVSISNELLSRYPDSVSYRAEVAYALNNMGFAREAKGDARAALEKYRAALAIMAPLVRRDSTHTEWVVTLASLHNAAAVAERKTGELDASLRDHRAELAIKTALLARDTTNKDWQRYLAIAHNYMGDILLWTGQVAPAIAQLDSGRRIYESLVAGDEKNVAWKLGLSSSYRRTAGARLESGDAAGALRELELGRALTEVLGTANATNPALPREQAATGVARARALMRLGRTADARASAAKAVEIADAAFAKKPADLERRKLLADANIVLGEALSLPADAGGATTAWARALVLVDSVASATKETEFLALQATAMMHLGGSGATSAVNELTRRGYRRPSFVALARTKGVAAP